ncbi:MAG: ATP-binding protein [Bacteroidetes bacterium]|nr:ATP-binding protein [Bacteroidota bacterium]
MPNKDQFTFEISLSVLNHLGRNLYRSFATVLGEAISNSWDASAQNVWLYIDKKENSLLIKDDGKGMTEDDFQNKFLKIGYSKRKDKNVKPPKGRSFIGRKGIGKLALLSCADRITVISKTESSDYVGGIIDNFSLDKAIENDLTPDKYPLEEWKSSVFEEYVRDHKKGTIIHFENIKDGIKNSIGFLKKTIALYFRFSLIDPSFKIFINDEQVTQNDLKDLAQKTEFLWIINELDDPYIKEMLTQLKQQESLTIKDGNYKGFIASVEKPRDLKITNIEERLGVDLFVNGRLRETKILKHIPTSRIVENYLYGQIHFNNLDDEIDRFTSSRESIIADDPKYKEFLDNLRTKVITPILDQWDKWRIKNRKAGDSENLSISPKERKSVELFNVVSGEYSPPRGSVNKKQIDGWVDDLADDAKYNFGSYAECFISENLIRKFIKEKKITLSKEAIRERDKWKKVETESKNKGNISIDIRKASDDLSYLSMNDLAYLVDKKDPVKEACLARDANEYKPIRDALAHTALLTDVAKGKLTSVYENIKGRVISLLYSSK